MRLMIALMGLTMGLTEGMSPTKLIQNKIGSPLEVGKNNTDICKGRTHRDSECSVLLDVPATCAGDKSTCPVAIFLHGEGAEKGKMFARGTDEVSSVVHSAGYIGIYPTADGQWNTDGNSTKSNDEAKFMIDIIDFVAGIGAFDTWQPKMGGPAAGTPGLYVYGTGTGAAMAQKLAANAGPHLPIRGIFAEGAQLLSAPARSGPGVNNFNQPGVYKGKRKTMAVAVAAAHGTADTLFPFSGGATKTDSAVCPACKLMSEAASNAAWAKHNGCNSTGITSVDFPATYGLIPLGGKANTTTATLHTFKGCPDVAPVQYWSVKNVGEAGATTINKKKMTQYVIEFFEQVQFAQPSTLPPAKPDLWHDPGELAPLVCGIVVIVCFCCVFCGFGRSGGGRARPFLGAR